LFLLMAIMALGVPGVSYPEGLSEAGRCFGAELLFEFDEAMKRGEA
jgi:hypothetical protein